MPIPDSVPNSACLSLGIVRSWLRPPGIDDQQVGSRASEWLCMCVYTCVHVFKHVWLSEWKTKIILEKFDEEMKEREERRGSIRANQAASAVFSWANVRARPGFLAGIGKSSSLGNRKSYPLKYWSRIQHNSFLSWQLFSTKSDHGKLTSWP